MTFPTIYPIVVVLGGACSTNHHGLCCLPVGTKAFSEKEQTHRLIVTAVIIVHDVNVINATIVNTITSNKFRVGVRIIPCLSLAYRAKEIDILILDNILGGSHIACLTAIDRDSLNHMLALAGHADGAGIGNASFAIGGVAAIGSVVDSSTRSRRYRHTLIAVICATSQREHWSRRCDINRYQFSI